MWFFKPFISRLSVPRLAHRHGTVRLLTGLSFILLWALGFADERILDYNSNIIVHTDGSLLVTETLRVRTEGNLIKRGIYRDFPTRYKDRQGNSYQVTFNLVDVQRDGADEAYHIENRANGVRIYAGSANHMLTAGIHTYKLRFDTSRQLGFFDDFDELYWNVTGNGWRFPIDHASARIQLPSAVQADQLRIDFYTGGYGSRDKHADYRIISDRIIEFSTNQGLLPRQGLTVAVGWPKGLVHEPTRGEKITFFLQDNGAALVLLIGLLLPLGWYLWAWNLYGRDPRKGIIIPRFEPPKALTPAACNYIHKMSFNQQAFSAAVVSLGVKGYLKIQEDSDDFKLVKTQLPEKGGASKGEMGVYSALFTGSDDEIELDKKNYRVFALAQRALRKALKQEYYGRLFKLNSIYALPAIIMNVVSAIIAIGFYAGPAVWIPFAVLSLALHLIFLFLLRAPTPAGRRIMDEIEGFKMYLDTAEQDRLEQMKSTRLTPEVFEMFLPYAYALGVENSWCERFAREFPKDLNANDYHPAWYVGSSSGLVGITHLGSHFGSEFSTAISSASTPPGSSSGSGGGGFSGGGGGGGGGGGW